MQQKWVITSGFCPKMQLDYNIDVLYVSEDGKHFDAVSEKCAYHNFSRCDIAPVCPIRARAPRSFTVGDEEE